MKKKTYSILLILSFILCTFFAPASVKAEATQEMNIYAMYLDSPEKGESTLLESKGHALLIDLGRYSHLPSILKQLKALNITHLDICLSHLHSDHMGGSSTDILASLRTLTESGITVDHLYLPAKEFAIYSSRYQAKYEKIENYMSSRTSIQYLSLGSFITVGDITGRVIGPVTDWSFTPQKYADSSGNISDQMYTLYENNCSLAMIFTCGNTRYFCSGDGFSDETDALVSRYGSALSCDIMKLCHHGTPSGNSQALIDAVSPTYSFSSNAGFTGKNTDNGHWSTFTAGSRATQYGMCYHTASQKKTLIFHVVNDQITLYQGLTVSKANKLTGWQYLYGSDGINMDYNTYYLDSNGKPLTGLQKIGNKYYSFDSTGLLQYGGFDENGEYNGWVDTPAGTRYYRMSTSKKSADVAVGFQTIDDTLYYFSPEGYLYLPAIEENGDPEIKKIGSSYYAIESTGSVASDEWLETDAGFYYFNKAGKMQRNCACKIENDYYVFDASGHLMTSDSGYRLVTLGGKKYAVNPNGQAAVSRCVKINKNTYYFSANGSMVKSKAVKIGKNLYYFNAKGMMVRNKTIKWHGTKYKCLANGRMKRVK